ncbi:prephenate dehydratase [Heyndrickxia ginsengihumi]|uniref:Prephenate dehydratase n=1 Tax=Heyndrickxia ginsengihumi TaxID=363870 RepID=A0A0A6VH15_9BACI|nr:prephenate dehydratase [Heyndrickxia ginsengihumi]KHD86866.1 prephenate dehydratase [Heyndrickxia ginsengihumi]MBE6184158.1 prephenate dehydratase [Bacillus sp. (in: firmicutes)]MCM3021869.1 prephenate dehydratase [Heyndrickxia ginsengihumi]NEY20444.1 prephenate dehydratase [Heyndrickxia ginsengihumi]
MKAAYLGPEATFTDIAVQSIFPNVERIAYKTIPECLEAVKEKKVEMAVVPFENALEGSVHLTVDYLYHEENPPIRGEIIVPIEQHFMVHPAQANDWQEVEKIVSHPHALAQCHKFLHHEFRRATIEQMTSTAAAAKFVSEHPELKWGAIANELAAQQYDLTIVKANVHDYLFNHTRFIALSYEEIDAKASSTLQKSTIMVTLPADRAGALHQVLSAFAWRQINLSKLESRPLKTGLGNYFFMIDINHPIEDVLVQYALKEIEALGCEVKVLGSYSSFLVK